MKTRAKLWTLVALLGAVHILLIFPGFFAPYDYSAQNRELSYAPPSRIHFFDSPGKFHCRPFVYAMKQGGKTSDSFSEDFVRAYPIQFFVSGAPYSILGMFTSRRHLFGVGAPASISLMGTDEFGRDEFSRVLYGGRISLLAGIVATLVSLSLGAVLGTLAGFYRGWLDVLLMRGVELFLALPWLYLLLTVRAALPLHISTVQTFLVLVAVLGMVGWARPARLVRGVVLSAKERNYVRSARGFGASDFYLLRRHIAPQLSSVLLTQVALLVPQYILAEVTLSFLGLGVSEPVPSWGNLLACLQQYSVLASYWWMLFPMLMIVPLFAGYQALAGELARRSSAAVY
ncbi:MAG TPA: ABC transporter permease [Candidatus Acidoferrales bacterium]|nr:ABC transporter permease [Candidatus Acidoferrales bacterium]